MRIRLPSLRDLRIGQRLGLGFALLTGLLLALMLLGILNMGRINQRMDHILRMSNAKVWHTNAIRDAGHNAERAALLMALPSAAVTRSLEHVKLMTAWAALGQSLWELEQLESETEGRALVDRLRRAMEAAADESRRTLEGEWNQGSDGSAVERMQTLHTSLRNLQDLCAELVVYEREQTERVYEQVRSTYDVTRKVSLILAGIGVLVALLMAIRLTRSITEPLREGVEIAHRLADGDLTVDIRTGRNDETGALLKAMREMADRLRQAKGLEAQLRQAQKLETVGHLAGGVAHDFNNILTVINGHAQMGQLLARNGADLRPHFVAIEQAGNRAAGLTRQLLAFSRKQVMNVQLLDLSVLVGDLKKMLTRLIGEDIELVTSLVDGVGKVKADPVQIEQIVLNLAVNARDAMPSGGRLTIETRDVELDESYPRRHPGAIPGRYVMLAVTDTGVGMNAEVRERIFEPFFTTKEVGKGTGLGLSTVYGIVKQSHGDILAYSEPGRGTTFKVYLPRVEDGVASIPQTPASTELLRGDEIILLVEDEAPVRAVVRRVLGDCGYTVLEASNGREALEVRARHRGPIHLLITDMVMPGMNGVQLAERLSQDCPDLGVLFMSGYTEHSMVAEGFCAAGTVHFLPKPFRVAELSRRVRKILDDAAGGHRGPAKVTVETEKVASRR
jgi:signal transduction histidine kinase/CheY-like chemotaxis protein